MSTFQYGLEIEYTPEEIARPGARFQPVGPLEVHAARWSESTPEERGQWIRDCLAPLEYGDHVELLRSPNKNLPLLHRDDTGNLEFTFEPVDRREQLFEMLESAWNLTGPGSLQATVSLSNEDFFGPLESRQSRLQELLGWFNFHHQLDPLERLERNRLRATADLEANASAATEVGRFLRHPFLGPMIELRHKLLRKTLQSHARNEAWSREDLHLVIRREHSFKYVGSTAYRPDLAGPERICLEIRDVHKDAALLKERLRRLEHDFPGGLREFAPFATLPAFDSEAAWLHFTEAEQNLLMALFPANYPAAVLDFPKARFTHETYRNFAWPDANWESWQTHLGFSLNNLVDARELYHRRLLTLARDIGGHETTQGTWARRQIGFWLANFFRDSGLHESFRRKARSLRGFI